MGGPGSGGHKNSPGDVETHSAWEVIAQEPDSAQKLAQVRCKYCGRVMAQHTSRQRAHLLQCQQYLTTMKEQGIETSITRQASDPAGFFRNSKSIQTSNSGKQNKPLKMQEHPIAVRIQALALAEASISSERIQEITGIDAKVLAGLRSLARERGYDPKISMTLKEEYVLDPPSTPNQKSRPRKRKPEEELDSTLSIIHNSRAPPGYVQPESLPPGNWNFMAPTPHGYTLT